MKKGELTDKAKLKVAKTSLNWIKDYIEQIDTCDQTPMEQDIRDEVSETLTTLNS